MQPSHTIQRIFIHLLSLSALCCSQPLLADVILPSVDDKFIELTVEDPTRDAGYVVGDILNRTVTITIKKPYELIEESLPIIGYEHRYRGEVSGIELVGIDKKTTTATDSETHVLDLSYQVFKTHRMAKPAALPAEILKLRNTQNPKEIVQYRIPSFKFRISPLSLIGQIKLAQEMYPFTPPLTLDTNKAMLHIKLLAGLLALSMLGLLYILGTRAWLPRMGAPFARAYREVKKLDDSPDGIKQAVSCVHAAMNKTAGMSLFSHNLAALLDSKPTFKPAQYEIVKFFGFSHQVFFEDCSQPLNSVNPRTWLLTLCRQLRDCERGLVPDIMQGDNT